MLRLVVSELVGAVRVWLGVAVVTAAAAVAMAVAAALIIGAEDVGGVRALALYGISGTVITFTAVAGVVVLSSVGELTVALQRRSHALWLLVGVRPGAVEAVVLGQLLVVAVVGAVVGCLVAAPAVHAVGDRVFADSPYLAAVHLHLSVRGAAWVVLAVAGLVLFSGLRPARRAGRASGVELLRDPSPPELRMGPARWVIGLGAVLAVVSVVASLRGREAETVESPLSLVGPLLAAAAVAFGPLFIPLLMRTWTSWLPTRGLVAWWLARNAVHVALTRSTAAVNPLIVAMALTGGFWGAHGAASGASSGSSPSESPPASGVLLLLGGPLLVAVLGSAATVAMSGRAREREQALIRTAGGTGGVVISAAVGEALALVGTALVLAGTALAITAIAGAWALGTAALVGVLTAGLPALFVTAASTLGLVAVATVVPTALALRREPVRALAATD